MMSEGTDARITEILKAALPEVVAIYRFGSTAKGLAVRESDLDIAVEPSCEAAPRAGPLQQAPGPALAPSPLRETSCRNRTTKG